jgi:uncharacterized protein (DUF1810 family)
LSSYVCPVSKRADPFRLERFITAQEAVFPTVLTELRSGQKRSHWIWFVFPQLAGLGTSPTARHFAIGGLEEAAAYLAHPMLGHRLIECTNLVVAYDAGTLEDSLGWPDNLKFHSSVTLFSLVAGHDSAFHNAIAKHFMNACDQRTLQLLRKQTPDTTSTH